MELLRNLFGGTICEGTLANMIRKVSGSLDTSLETIRAMLAGADVANFDETGASVKGKLQWIHVECTTRQGCDGRHGCARKLHGHSHA